MFLLNALLPRNCSPTLVYKICSALLPNTWTTVGYIWVWKMLQLFPLHNYTYIFNTTVKNRIDSVHNLCMLITCWTAGLVSNASPAVQRGFFCVA